MIVYTNQCLACFNKRKWRELRLFANKFRLKLEERKVSKNPSWRTEAESFDLKMPFVVEGDIAISIDDDLEKLL